MATGDKLGNRPSCGLWLLVLFVASLILAGTIGNYPLTDKTEGRYAEIARIMVVTGDWITPRLEPDVPFWGKPPLEFWLTAISFKTLGLNEFAARLPSLLLILFSVGLTFLLGKKRNGVDSGLTSSAILLTSGVVLLSASMVITDSALIFATTLSMVSFWLAYSGNSKLWGYLFFIGIALGLLAKGPIAGVLVMAPITLWVIWQKAWLPAWQRLPWLTGTLLTLVIALPWYLLAELKTPGFINYFIIGEHIMRFIDSGWKGDLYGGAHSHPKGTIWLYWLLTTLPWSIVTITVVYRWFSSSEKKPAIDDWRLYLLLWGLTPLLFFSLTNNILPTYILPALPAIALMAGSDMSVILNKKLAITGLLIPVGILIVGVAFIDVIEGRSQKQLISDFSGMKHEQPIVYLFKRPYSADFYSNGSAILVDNPDKINWYMDNSSTQYFAIKNTKLSMLGTSIVDRLTLVKEYPRYSMYCNNC